MKGMTRKRLDRFLVGYNGHKERAVGIETDSPGCGVVAPMTLRQARSSLKGWFSGKGYTATIFELVPRETKP
jgi:hypothetical protein